MPCSRIKGLRDAIGALSGLLLSGCVSASATSVVPFAETQILAPRTVSDFAVWVDGDDPGKSLVLVAAGSQGLLVLGLNGEKRQTLAVGDLTDIELRENSAVALNRTTNALMWFAIESESREVRLAGESGAFGDEIVQFCAGNIDGVPQVVTLSKSDTAQVRIAENLPHAAGPVARISLRLNRLLVLDAPLSSCIFDEEHDRLFLSDEEGGIWSVSANTAPGIPAKIGKIAPFKAETASSALAIRKDDNGAGYLLAAVSSLNQLHVFDRLAPHRWRGAISVRGAGRLDRVTLRGGVDVSITHMRQHSRGALLVHDAQTFDRKPGENFKIVDWRAIEKALQLR